MRSRIVAWPEALAVWTVSVRAFWPEIRLGSALLVARVGQEYVSPPPDSRFSSPL